MGEGKLSTGGRLHMAFPSDAAARTRGYVRILSSWAILMACYEQFARNWSPAEERECPSLQDVVEHLFGLAELVSDDE
jgi:hypothetical protein